jgi:presenilin-like A22 family membrane protease
MKRVSLLLYSGFFVAMLVALFFGYHLVVQGVSMVEDSTDPANAVYFMGYILVATVVMLIVIKLYAGHLLFTALEVMLELLAAQLAAALFMPIEASFAVGLAVAALRLLVPALKPFLLGFSAVVVGALLGSSLDWLPIILLAVLLSVYDFLAVFKTKHMVKIAESLQKRGTALAITVKSGKDWVQLGTGDFVIPAALLVSALKVSFSAAFYAFCGAMLGMTALVFLLERRKGYWPALPPLVAGTLIGFAVFALTLAF